MLKRDFQKTGFTLAEVLITLGIIGVVAVLILPGLSENITERINSNRQANIAYKITQATDVMKALGLLANNYQSTDDFVDELQKHLSIAKRCDAAHITECWPTEKVTASDGKIFEVSKAKIGKNLNIKSNTSNNVGLILADGASIILTYNQSGNGLDVGDKLIGEFKTLPVGFGKSQEFAYTTSSTGFIDFVMDVNGKKGPNSETINNKFHDIRSFKAASFSKGCTGADIPGIGCVVNLGTSYASTAVSRWDGAKKACNDISMSLPDISTLKNVWNKRKTYPALPQSGDFWSSTEASDRVNVIYFSDGSTGKVYKYYNYSAMCIGD